VRFTPRQCRMGSAGVYKTFTGGAGRQLKARGGHMVTFSGAVFERPSQSAGSDSGTGVPWASRARTKKEMAVALWLVKGGGGLQGAFLVW